MLLIVYERFTRGGAKGDGVAGEAFDGCQCHWWWVEGEHMFQGLD